MKNRGLIISVVIGCVAVGALLIHTFSGSSQEQYIFETTKVEVGNITNSITATGTLEASNTVVVGTQVSGIVEKLYVDFNSVVTEGQLIAELDKAVLQTSLESAEADLDRSKADFEFQEKNMARMQSLFDKKVLSQNDYDQAVYSYKLSKANLKASQANVDKAERNLSYAYIYAPIDGIVLNRNVEEGQTVTASMNTPELFTITDDLSIMEVEADVDEADIGMVKVDQRVDFTVDAFPDDTFEGKISEVRLQPNEASNVITYTVVVTVDNPEKKLKPGMTASITAYVQEANNVLLLAGKATRFSPSRETMMKYYQSLPEDQRPARMRGGNSGGGMGGSRPNMQGGQGSQGAGGGMRGGMSDDPNKKMVWIKDGNAMKPVPITIGISDGTQVQIISGLNEGDEIITSMEEGTPVEVEKEETASSPFMPQRPGRSGGGGGPR